MGIIFSHLPGRLPVVIRGNTMPTEGNVDEKDQDRGKCERCFRLVT
jgi:hypothetical protein